MKAGAGIQPLSFQMADAGDFRPEGAKPSALAEAERAIRVVIAGGGTGGHLFPGIAVAEEIRARSRRNQVLFISRGSELERSVLARAGFPLEAITVEGFKGRSLWHQFRVLCLLPRGLFQAIRRLRVFRPDVVIGLGSYSAGPVVAAAWLLRTPIALCEQNTLPGITNRLLSRLADRVFISFKQTGGGLDPHKVLWTGNPLRREIAAAACTRASRQEREEFTVLVIGGSQGAHAINLAVAAALERLGGRERLFFIHQTGAADEQWVRAAYRRAGIAASVQAFFDDMAAAYRQADWVICRAGATTVAEISALGKAAVFIPFPHAADNHQRLNARCLVEAGAAEMIDESQLSAEWLAERIGFYASHPEVLARLGEQAARLGKPDAARRVVDECYRLVAQHAAGRRANRKAQGR